LCTAGLLKQVATLLAPANPRIIGNDSIGLMANDIGHRYGLAGYPFSTFGKAALELAMLEMASLKLSLV
jgi:hypothetical protein